MNAKVFEEMIDYDNRLNNTIRQMLVELREEDKEFESEVVEIIESETNPLNWVEKSNKDN